MQRPALALAVLSLRYLGTLARFDCLEFTARFDCFAPFGYRVRTRIGFSCDRSHTCGAAHRFQQSSGCAKCGHQGASC